MTTNVVKCTVKSEKPDTLTAAEVRNSMKRICKSKKSSEAFLKKIGISIDKKGQVKVTPI